jgi:hypothetical protein
MRWEKIESYSLSTIAPSPNIHQKFFRLKISLSLIRKTTLTMYQIFPGNRVYLITAIQQYVEVS